MADRFQFGLVVRGQAEQGEDIARRFQETLAFVRLADRLGFDSITKTAHYSAYPFQMLQLVPMLARFARSVCVQFSQPRAARHWPGVNITLYCRQ